MYMVSGAYVGSSGVCPMYRESDAYVGSSGTSVLCIGSVVPMWGEAVRLYYV